jgi:predicted AAA+ superfamily ATPase
MLRRKISSLIEKHLTADADRVLIIDGARQTGKSFIIREVGQRLFPNFIEINMEEDKLQDRLFADARTVADFYMALSVVAGERMGERRSTLVFIDEIQAYDHLLTLLKFLNADRRFTFVASGSMLGVALRQTSSLPVGSIRIEHMYPMDFEEFLWANGVGEELISAMRRAFEEARPLPQAIHAKVLDLMRKYLLVGGMPAAVNAYVSTQNIQEVRSIQTDISAMYGIDASKYEESVNRRLKIRRILEMIPSSLENKKKRIVFKDIEGKDWKRADNYADEFDYLIAAGVALEVKAISQPTYPLIENSGKNLLKLYLNDIGILSGIYFRNNISAIMQDQCGVNLGAVYESFVAQELRAHGNPLYYYDNKKVGEVDFLTDSAETLSVVPIEVKSGKDYTIHSALDRFLSVRDYAVKRAYVLSNAPEVRVDGGITYMPIYYIMFLR